MLNLMKSYYETLGVDENAEIEVINAAHKALAKKYHPDTFKGNKKNAEEKLKQINAAHDVLSNPQKRKKYDSTLNERGKKNNFEDASDFDADFDSEPVLKDDWKILIEVFPEAEEMRKQLVTISPSLSFNYQIQLIVFKNAEQAVNIAELIAKEFFEKYFGKNNKVHILVQELLVLNKRHIAKEINKKITLLGTNSSERILRDIEIKYSSELAEMRYQKAKHPHPNNTSNANRTSKEIRINTAVFLITIISLLFILANQF